MNIIDKYIHEKRIRHAIKSYIGMMYVRRYINKLYIGRKKYWAGVDFEKVKTLVIIRMMIHWRRRLAKFGAHKGNLDKIFHNKIKVSITCYTGIFLHNNIEKRAGNLIINLLRI